VTTAAGFSSGDINPPLSDVLGGAARKAASLTPGGTAVRNGDLTFQFVSENFRARLQLLESKNRVTVVATPMLMTANNEVSRLFVGEERPIVRNISSQTLVNNNTVTSTPNTTIEFRPVGTTLLITPNINSDHTVTLRLLQENSTINPGGATIPVVSGNGAVRDQAVDVVSTRTVSGTVVAKNEMAVAVGGLIEDSLQDQRAMVPILGKVPGLGTFFRRQNTNRRKRELIVMVRPHILSTPAESEAISQKLLNELSIHPKASDTRGTLDTFLPQETLRPNPPTNLKENVLRPHSVKPRDY
jgi:general secretion pathway protein D